MTPEELDAYLKVARAHDLASLQVTGADGQMVAFVLNPKAAPVPPPDNFDAEWAHAGFKPPNLREMRGQVGDT